MERVKDALENEAAKRYPYIIVCPSKDMMDKFENLLTSDSKFTACPEVINSTVALVGFICGDNF